MTGSDKNELLLAEYRVAQELQFAILASTNLGS